MTRGQLRSIRTSTTATKVQWGRARRSRILPGPTGPGEENGIRENAAARHRAGARGYAGLCAGRSAAVLERRRREDRDHRIRAGDHYAVAAKTAIIAFVQATTTP